MIRAAMPVRFEPDVAQTPVALTRAPAWLHHGSTEKGVIICGAQGFEGLCTHQTARVLADLVARAGPNVLRFDYPGEGDALDRADEEDAISAWCDSLSECVDWMRDTVGSASIGLVGIRLGGLIALEAIRRGLAVDTLALIAPPSSGTAYVRELKATARMYAGTRMGCSVDDAGISICGYRIDGNLARSIQTLKPSALVHPPGARVLLAESEDRRCDIVADELDRIGSDYSRLPFAGYAEMMSAPTAAKAPLDMLNAIAEWMACGARAAAVRPFASTARALTGDGFHEELVEFGSTHGLRGVLCLPAAPVPRIGTLVMLNAGAINHRGWARMSVRHARDLARRGKASLRLDLSGVGDSAWNREGPRPLLYSKQHIADARQALDWLEGQGHSGLELTGLCAGGYVALHAAHQDSRVRRVIATNVDKLVWHDHYDLDVLEQELNQSSTSYARQAFTGTTWKRILAGDVSAQRIVSILKLLSTKAAIRLVDPMASAMGIEIGLDDDSRLIRGVFSDLSKRGVSVHMVYADRDSGIDELDLHCGPQARFLRNLAGASVTMVEKADHEFTPQAAQDALFQILLGERAESPLLGLTRAA